MSETITRKPWPCDCGCGEVIRDGDPVYGGYDRIEQRSAWFVSNEHMAAFEAARKADPTAVRVVINPEQAEAIKRELHPDSVPSDLATRFDEVMREQLRRKPPLADLRRARDDLDRIIRWLEELDASG